MSELALFGEVTSGNMESKYTYANAVAITLLNKLKDLEDFQHVKESDIVNAGLVFLNLFFNVHIDVEFKEDNEKTIIDMVLDGNEFKDFLTVSINHCKMHNIMLNDEIMLAGDKDGF